MVIAESLRLKVTSLDLVIVASSDPRCDRMGANGSEHAMPQLHKASLMRMGIRVEWIDSIGAARTLNWGLR